MICKYTTRHDIEIPDIVSLHMMVASPVSNAGHNRFTVTQKGTTEARQQTNQQASNEPVLKQASRYSAPCIVACKRIGQSSHDVRKLFNTPPRFDRIPPQDVNRITEEYVMACSKTLNDCRMLLSAKSDRLPVTGKRSEGRDGSAVPMWKGSSCRSLLPTVFPNTHGARGYTWMCGRGMGMGGRRLLPLLLLGRLRLSMIRRGGVCTVLTSAPATTFFKFHHL